MTCIMAVVLSGNVSAGSIYKCIDATGNVSFSQTACQEKASGGQIGYSAPSQYRKPERIIPHSIASQVRQLDAEEEKKAAKHKPEEALEDMPTAKRLRIIEKKHLNRMDEIREEARGEDPAEANRKCAAAKFKEQAILKSDPQAEYMRALDLFEARSWQDLYCEKYERKVIRSQGSEVPYVK